MLNKKGWGLVEMLILSGVLIIFLFIAIYFIYRLYGNLDEGINTNYYTNLENDLRNQAEEYLNDYYDDTLTSDYITITRNVLKTYDLDVILEDPQGRECSGYVRANKSHAKVNIEAYISCSKYETDGYESWRE